MNNGSMADVLLPESGQGELLFRILSSPREMILQFCEPLKKIKGKRKKDTAALPSRPLPTVLWVKVLVELWLGLPTPGTVRATPSIWMGASARAKGFAAAPHLTSPGGCNYLPITDEGKEVTARQAEEIHGLPWLSSNHQAIRPTSQEPLPLPLRATDPLGPCRSCPWPGMGFVTLGLSPWGTGVGTAPSPAAPQRPGFPSTPNLAQPHLKPGIELSCRKESSKLPLVLIKSPPPPWKEGAGQVPCSSPALSSLHLSSQGRIPGGPASAQPELPRQRPLPTCHAASPPPCGPRPPLRASEAQAGASTTGLSAWVAGCGFHL